MFKEALIKILRDSGFAAMNWQYAAMIVVACILIYLAVVKKIRTAFIASHCFWRIAGQFTPDRIDG